MKTFIFKDELKGYQSDLSETKTFQSRNGWIAPNGDFYGCQGSQHYQTACWLCIFVLGVYPEDLEHQTYFKETFESRIRKDGWVCIKDTSWLGIEDHEDPADFRKIFRVENTTEEQEKTIEKYFKYYE